MDQTANLQLEARCRATFELYEWGEEIMRQSLRRRFAQATDAEIERRLLAWLRKLPYEGPELADPQDSSTGP